jgi:hypothetical protein
MMDGRIGFLLRRLPPFLPWQVLVSSPPPSSPFLTWQVLVSFGLSATNWLNEQTKQLTTDLHLDKLLQQSPKDFEDFMDACALPSRFATTLTPRSRQPTPKRV